ncbi:cysteine hydrolase family protein [Elizabethkingia meningoseptica]|uniref:cysteine hydrolase family protein n=1 Tax=Elizabethkingia meningoseptica TaxID=238 RepID=UPI00389289C0
MEINWNRSALMIIDMQNDFAKTGGKAYINGTEEVIKNISIMADLFRINQLPVIHIVRLYLEDGSNADLCRKEVIQQGKAMVIPGSSGAKIVQELLPKNAEMYEDKKLLIGNILQLAPFDFVAYKPRWGAFYKTNLEAWLKNRKINSLVITGCNFPNCPRTTIFEASERDYRLAIVPEAISQIYPKGIDELKGIGVNVLEHSVLKKELEYGK